MKKTIILAAAAALLFTSCEKKEHAPLHEASVSFVIDGPVTRVTTVDNVTSFEDNDVIAITSEGLAADITAAEYTVTGTGLTGESVTTYNGDKTASFLAHYPASAEYADGSLTFTVPAAQTADNFHASMFMVAQATGSAASHVVSLKFKHQLAWVKVVLSNIAGVAVNLNGVLPTATWTKDALTASGEAINVSMWKQTDAQTYWALIPAQTIAAGTKLITIETADKGYEFTLAEDLAVSTAKVKTITLSVEADETVSASFTVDGTEDAEWTDEETGLSGNVTETVIDKTIISAEAGDFSKVTLNANVTGWASAKELGWTPIINGAENGSVTLDPEAGTICLTRNTGLSDWYNIGLVYHVKDVKSGKYLVTLNARCSNPELGTGTNADGLHFRIYSTTGSSQIGSTGTVALNNEGSVAKREITLSENYDNGIHIVFYPKSADGYTYAIRSVTMTEKTE